MPASNSKIEYNCCEVIDQVYVSRSELKDQPLLNQDEVDWYAIVSSHKIIAVQALPPITSAQLAKLIGFTRALELGKEKKTENIC